jgi:predicted Zn finger-like uncharacterized protein
MPKIVQCPNCQRRLRVPDDLLGKQVKCPACDTLLTVRDGEDLSTSDSTPTETTQERQRSRRRRPLSGEEYEPDEEEQYEEEEEDFEEAGERPRRRASERRSWRKVRTGLTLEIVSICVLVLAVLIAMIGGIILAGGEGNAARAGGVPRGGGVEALAGIVGLMYLASAILAIVGYIFCMQVPPKHGAKGLAVAALVLAGASLLVVIISGIIDVARGPGEVRPLVGKDAQQGFRPLEAVGVVLNAAKVLVFLFFMFAVAKSLRARSLEKSIKHVIILSGLAVGAWVALMVLALLGAGAGGGLFWLASACVCLVIILGFVTFLCYLVTLGQVRRRISRYLLSR